MHHIKVHRWRDIPIGVCRHSCIEMSMDKKEAVERDE